MSWCPDVGKILEAFLPLDLSGAKVLNHLQEYGSHRLMARSLRHWAGDFGCENLPNTSVLQSVSETWQGGVLQVSKSGFLSTWNVHDVCWVKKSFQQHTVGQIFSQATLMQIIPKSATTYTTFDRRCGQWTDLGNHQLTQLMANLQTFGDIW